LCFLLRHISLLILVTGCLKQPQHVILSSDKLTARWQPDFHLRATAKEPQGQCLSQQTNHEVSRPHDEAYEYPTPKKDQEQQNQGANLFQPFERL
jgi:hypothetical protein